MAFTQSDLVAVDEAIATGVLKIQKSDGSSMEYRSIRELKAARLMIEQALALADGKARRRAVVTHYNQGL
jgi:hypothetical protein